MLKTTKRVLSLLLALVMVIGIIPVTLAYAAESVEPPVMEADDDSWDIPLADLTVSCGDYEPDGGASEGPASLAVDNDTSTMWHTDWYGTSRDNHWFQFAVAGDYTVCGLRYLPRQTGNSNGTITRYEILVSDDGTNFRSVVSGDWAADSTWKIAQFSGEKVKYVRLIALNAETDNAYVFASAAEIRLTYLPTEVSDADKTALNALIAECELIEQGNYTAKSWQQFQKALEKAQTVSANAYASQTQVDEAYEALAQAKAGLQEQVEGEGPQKIFHLDSGRKFFSKDWIIALLNELSAAGYTHLQLAFGNNGFRFILDDMTIEANGTTYASDDVKAGIKIGNANYYDEGEKHALTESEMDEILAHADRVGIQIIPHLNMPGHMSALLDAMEYVGISGAHFTGSVQSDSSVNLNNEAALNFMKALVDKYAAYFSEAGCDYFHIGADEYANDAYNGSMGFPSMGATLYQKFADFVNENAAIVESYGMIPRAWNDGISYGSYTAQFDSDIEINYWSSGWWGYDLAKASKLAGNGHGMINTNGDYYYILGKDDRFTSGSSTTHSPNLYTECAGFDITRFMDGSVIEEPVGATFCVWADYPGAETETEVAANIRLILRAMALRMDGLDIDDLDTSVVPGGFNEDGTINKSEAHEHTFDQQNTDEEYLATPADCENAATYYYSCSCGLKGTETFTHGEALGHDYGDPTFTWNEDNTAKASFVCSRDASHVHEMDATVTSTTTEGDCLHKAVTTYTATVTFEEVTYTDSKIVEGNLGDHADENADGKCDVCGELLGVIRVAGAGRWQTALLVADEMKAALGDEKFDAIIIASGNDFADALAGSYLATVKNAPILLSYGGDNEKYAYLDNDNINYVKENLAQGGKVYILGGEKAVPTLYEDGLEGYDVVRLGGANRFETNILILEEAGIADGSEVLVCTSANFADSLSASATGKPILLVWNDSGALYGSQPEFLEELKEKNCTFTILGGENAVSAKLADEVAKYGEVDRLAGNTRMETSVLVAEKYFDAPETAVLAYAWNYPDGLCGGSLAYALKAPLILTMPKYEAAAVEYADENDITVGYVLGGDGLIGDAEVRAIFAMAAADQIVVKN